MVMLPYPLPYIQCVGPLISVAAYHGVLKPQWHCPDLFPDNHKESSCCWLQERLREVGIDFVEIKQENSKASMFENKVSFDKINEEDSNSQDLSKDDIEPFDEDQIKSL